jgi:hypothetical protein
VLGQHLGLCFDACHQAVQFEDPKRAWSELVAAGIPVGKIQLSCALAAPGESADALGPFDEARFLHQVRRRGGDGALDARSDLGEALREETALSRDGDWRVHFHAPLHWRPEAGEALGTTVDDLLCLLPEIVTAERLPHLEVETYTWSVLPERLRPRDDESLIEGIAREIEFIERALAPLGIRREASA